MKSVVPSETAITTPNGATNSTSSQMAPGAKRRRHSRFGVTTSRARVSAGLHLRPLLIPQLQLCSRGHDLAQAVDRLVQAQAEERKLLDQLLVFIDARGR